MAKKTTTKSKVDNWMFGAGRVSIIRKGNTITIKNGNTEIFKSTKEEEFEAFWDSFKKAKRYLHIVKV